MSKHLNTNLAILIILLCSLTLTSSLSPSATISRLITNYLKLVNQSYPQSQQLSQQQVLTGQNTQFLISQTFKGTYQSRQNTNLFDYLDTAEGDLEVLFINDPLKSSTSSLNTMEIFLFNPKYHDLKAVGMEIDLDQMKEDNRWEKIDGQIKTQKFWKGRSQSEQQTIQNVTYTIQIINIDKQDATQVSLKITIDGPNFKFSANLQYYHDFLSTMGYSMYTTLIVGLQIFCAITLLKQIDQENPALLSKMSLFTLSMCNIEDFYFTMLHIEYIMSTGTAYLLFVLPSLAYLVLFVIFDMKMLFLVWRSHHMRNIQNPQVLRKKLTIFYIEFYLGLFVYLTLNYFFQYQYWLIFIQHMILVPQIVHNVRKGNNPGFSPYYVIGFLGLRYLVPLYQRGCPGNHFSLEPMPILVTILGALYIIEILILYFQSRYGPRFFVPRFLQRNYYNYNVKLKLSEENKDIDCSICLLNIFSPEPEEQKGGSSAMINESMQENLLEEIQTMKTPCNHYFHKDCLARWIDVKLECPTCRKPLPAL